MIDSGTGGSYYAVRDLLRTRLEERPPGRIQLLAGPRQVGKTTLLFELAEGFGERAIYAAADAPEASLPGFWERLWTRVESVATKHGAAVVLLDEVQLLHDWSAALKSEWDRIRRKRLPVHVVATGSSALRLTVGSRESLAGRFERSTLTHWNAASLVEAFGMKPEAAADQVVTLGAYPGAQELVRSPKRWSAYVRDAIVEPAIGRDILALASVRKPALLRQVFAVCASSPAQIVSLQKLQGQLQDAGALETIAHYLQLLEEAFLVAPLAKHAIRPARQRAAPPKLVALDNGLLAVTDPRGVPDRAEDPTRFGAWVENACIAHTWNAGQRVTYWREEPYEVDAIIDGSWGTWAVEIKTGAVHTTHLRGLGEFTRRHTKYAPLVLCDESAIASVERTGIRAMPWRDFLLHGPPTRS